MYIVQVNNVKTGGVQILEAKQLKYRLPNSVENVPGVQAEVNSRTQIAQKYGGAVGPNERK